MSLYTVQRSLLREHLVLRYTLTSIVLAHCYHVVQLFIYWEIIQKLYCSVRFNSKHRSGLLIIACIISTTIVRIYIGVLIGIYVYQYAATWADWVIIIFYLQRALYLFILITLYGLQTRLSLIKWSLIWIYTCVFICIIQTNTINTGKVFFLCNSIVTIITCILTNHYI